MTNWEEPLACHHFTVASCSVSNFWVCAFCNLYFVSCRAAGGARQGHTTKTLNCLKGDFPCCSPPSVLELTGPTSSCLQTHRCKVIPFESQRLWSISGCSWVWRGWLAVGVGSGDFFTCSKSKVWNCLTEIPFGLFLL